MIFFVFLFGLKLDAQCTRAWKILGSPVKDDIHDVFFLNDEIGWAYTYGTGIILKTVDGGENWQIIARLDPVYFEQIHFLDARIGWICGEQGKVLKSEDGGKTWLDRSLILPDSNALLYSQWFFSPDIGLVGGTLRYQGGTTEFCLFKTNDGGLSWLKMRNNPQVHLTQIVFVNARVGYAAGGNRIFETRDAGESWYQVSESQLSNKREGFRGLYFLNENVGYAVGASGEVVSTRDGGNNWEEKKITANRLRSVVFVSDSEGYIVGDQNNEEGVLYETKNGGKTWKAIQCEYPDLHRIIKSNNYIWAVGKEGTILRKKSEARFSPLEVLNKYHLIIS